jgi:hypothetical protein
MSEVNTNTSATEESIQQSIEELGGIPLIELDLEVSGMTAYPTDTTLEIHGMAADAWAVGDKLGDLQADVASINARTGADIPLTAEQGAPKIATQVGTNTTNIATNTSDINDIKAWTAADIPMSSTPGAQSVADAIGGIVSESYPVGSIYMTVGDEAPTFTGTWVEIAITATWAQLKTGKRGYAELEDGDSGGAVHFWLRTA